MPYVDVLMINNETTVTAALFQCSLLPSDAEVSQRQKQQLFSQETPSKTGNKAGLKASLHHQSDHLGTNKHSELLQCFEDIVPGSL